MKVILTGATGFVGAEVLLQLLDHPDITSIVTLSRRPISSSPYLPYPGISNHPKLRTIIMDHWTDYPEYVLRELDGAEACIWALGTLHPPDVETMRKVTIDYTLAATTTMARTIVPRLAESGRRFRFIYLSSMLTELNPSKSLRYAQEFRRHPEPRKPHSHNTKSTAQHKSASLPDPDIQSHQNAPKLIETSDLQGEVEDQLIGAPSHHPTSHSHLDKYVAAPGPVIRKDAVRSSYSTPTVRVDELAAGLIRVALRGDPNRVLENSRLKEVGRAVLRQAG